MQYLILLVSGLCIIAAVIQAGQVPLKAHKRAVRSLRKRQTGDKINVNINGHKVRTITVKSYTRKVSA
jgi:hypothetical protein